MIANFGLLNYRTALPTTGSSKVLAPIAIEVDNIKVVGDNMIDWWNGSDSNIVIALSILILKMIGSSKVSALIAIGANNNESISSSGGLKPNLFKSKIF